MPAIFGSSTGPVYPLGLVKVVSSGTPTPIFSNLPTAGQVVGYARNAPIQACKIKVMAPSANAGDVYLTYVAQGYASTNGVSVVLCVPKGTERILDSPQLTNPFQVSAFGLDGATGDGAFITLVIV